MGRPIKGRISAKERKYFSFLIGKFQLFAESKDNIDHKEIGTPKTHKEFLGI